ncbi:MAG: acyltransferase [Pseudomonadota bacterium]
METEPGCKTIPFNIQEKTTLKSIRKGSLLMVNMKTSLKNCLNCFCVALVFPLAVLSWFEKTINPASEVVFTFFAQLLACAPGLPGIFFRRAYYFSTVEKCSLCCVIGFGTLLVHRNVIIERDVSIGNYAIIGCAHIKSDCEIGSRVSVTSGKNQHLKKPNGKWSSFDHLKAQRLIIQPDVWIGEGAIIMAEVGRETVVGAGSVVTEEIPARVVAAGNPARVLHTL